MNKIFSTASVHPRDRFDYWHSTACQNLIHHSSRPDCKQTFEAEIETGTLADIRMVQFENSPMGVVHSAQHVSRTEDDDLFLCRQASGSLALEQAGRDLILETGDLVLLDPLLPYRAKFSGDSKSLVLKLPRRALEARTGQTREAIAVPVARSTQGGRDWISCLVEMLPEMAETPTETQEQIARDQILDLIASSLLKTGSSNLRISSARSVALLNVRAAVDARLSDAKLDCEAVAKAAGMSVRYANALLREQNMSITRLIRTRRLARCRAALEDPLQSRRSISEIAYGWGFSDMTHFGRCFKQEFGMLPRDYRHLCSGNVRVGHVPVLKT
jgi:AraC family transcriptional regulator, positive regulator of tynA and feaB